MMSVSFVKEAIIASITAAVAIPLLWVLTTPLDPSRDARSPGLDLAALTLVGAGMVMLLRSTWRETASPGGNRDRALDDWEGHKFGDTLSNGSC
jgi:hypothetical protein